MARSPELDLSVVVNAPPSRVLRAFFDADALHAWWQAVHSVTTPRALGAFAIEWAPTDFRDEVLGRLGGVFRGTIVHFDAGTGFFVADAYWLAPDGDPIGPMALEVAVKGVRRAGRRQRAGHRSADSPERIRGGRPLEALLRGDRRRLGARAPFAADADRKIDRDTVEVTPC